MSRDENENRDPQKEELALYSPFLRRQLEIIEPKVIVTLGRFAMAFILEEFNSPQQHSKISKLHGQPLHVKASYGPVTVILLFHPAVVLYRSDQKEILREARKQGCGRTARTPVFGYSFNFRDLLNLCRGSAKLHF